MRWLRLLAGGGRQRSAQLSGACDGGRTEMRACLPEMEQLVCYGRRFIFRRGKVVCVLFEGVICGVEVEQSGEVFFMVCYEDEGEYSVKERNEGSVGKFCGGFMKKSKMLMKVVDVLYMFVKSDKENDSDQHP